MSKNKLRISSWGIVGIIIVVIALLLIVSIILSHNSDSTAVSDSANSAGLMTNSAPWPAEIIHLRDRLASIGLPALTQEGTVLHTHQHLDIFINGKSVPVPAGIGINEVAGFISPIHVHDNTAVIHVESPVVKDFTLGQFFDVWGVRFTDQCIGAYCTDASSTLKLLVNGAEHSGDPRTLVLEPHQEIVITYGTAAQIPNPVPATYSFEPGE